MGAAGVAEDTVLMRFLVADDNTEIRGALRLLLDELGESDIVERTDQAGVLAAAVDRPIEALLLDWELPESATGRLRDGEDQSGCASLVQEVRRRLPECRIIAMSGRPEARADSLRAGCDGFVSRNEPPDRLVALLRAWGVGQ
jgi:DNA-binding NarL/FixJ family response regulator